MIPVAVALLLVVAPARMSQTPAPNDGPVIVAQGDAVVHQPADVAWVQIAVEARAGKPEDARQQAAVAMTSVISTVKKLVATDAVKTSTVSVQPEMEYTNNVPRVRGYVARNQIDVRVDDLEKLAVVMDASVSNGATSVAGLRFDLKKRAEAERDALRLAVQDATERAQAMASGAGRGLGPIVRIQEQRMSGGPILMQMSAGGMAGAPRASVETPVTAGEIEIHAQVMLTVSIK